MVAVLTVLLVPGAGESRTASRCPHAVEMIGRAEAFESRIGLSGCLTGAGYAFTELYRLRDAAAFRALADAPSGAAELYGLCGLEKLRAPDAAAVRRRLSDSQRTTSIEAGEQGPGPQGPLRELLRVKDHGTLLLFDVACDALVAPGVQRCDQGDRKSRRLCR